jgi:hypothetical protein
VRALEVHGRRILTAPYCFSPRAVYTECRRRCSRPTGRAGSSACRASTRSRRAWRSDGFILLCAVAHTRHRRVMHRRRAVYYSESGHYY